MQVLRRFFQNSVANIIKDDIEPMYGVAVMHTINCEIRKV